MSKRALVILFACFLTVLVAYSIRYAYGALLPEMLPALSITKTQAGVIYSSYFVAYTLLSPITGLLADRYSVKVMIAIFVAIMGAGAFLMQYPTSVLQATIFFTIAGIGCSACWTPVVTLAQRWASDKHRGMVLAFVDAGSAIGVMLIGALMPVVVANWGWEKGWMGLGIIGLVLGIADYLLIRDYPLKSMSDPILKSASTPKKMSISYTKLLRDKWFWLIGLAYLFTGFSVNIVFAFLNTYAVTQQNFSFSSATMLITIIGTGGLIGKLVLGPISDKLGRIRIMIICAILISVGTLGMVLGQRLPFMAFTSFIFGFGYGACWSMYAACARDFFPEQSPGGVVGLWTLYLGIGLILSPSLAGWVADATGNLMWALVLATVGGFLSLILLLPMLKQRQYKLVAQKDVSMD